MNSVDINPNRLIPQAITKLTSITDDMVKGQQINENEVASYLKDVDIIIAHNAQFDRTFFEITFPYMILIGRSRESQATNWNILHTNTISSTKVIVLLLTCMDLPDDARKNNINSKKSKCSHVFGL